MKQSEVDSIFSSLEMEEQLFERKNFIQGNVKIDYLNTSKIYCKEEKNSMNVQVSNYLCYQDNGTLSKVTEITYEDKVIRIEDKFQVTLNQDAHQQNAQEIKVSGCAEKPQEAKHQERLRLFKQSHGQKLDKKNIVKNVIKIFLQWLGRNPAGSTLFEQRLLCEKNLKLLLKNLNFNNVLIKNIIKDETLSKEFGVFLEEAAEDEIKYSKIQSKNSHYEAIEVYKELLRCKDAPNQKMFSLKREER